VIRFLCMHFLPLTKFYVLFYWYMTRLLVVNFFCVVMCVCSRSRNIFELYVHGHGGLHLHDGSRCMRNKMHSRRQLYAHTSLLTYSYVCTTGLPPSIRDL
jgi:hypothetical protein